MSSRYRVAAYVSTLLTVLIWGTTFISTKVLLNDFNPLDILFTRFLIGYVVLWMVYPRVVEFRTWRIEVLFILAGFCGVTLYFLLENIALTYTYASNVGIIASTAPFFTAILAHFFLKNERINPSFIIGFIIAIFGISLITFNGSFTLKLNPLGDLLAVLACICWAVYSIAMRKISELGYPSIGSTRRVFFYGLLLMAPAFLFLDFQLNLQLIVEGRNLFNILYLGLGASALCFVTWGWSVGVLGAVKTSSYIYLVPVVTVTGSSFFLNEKITSTALLGVLLTIVGLFVSEKRVKIKK